MDGYLYFAHFSNSNYIHTVIYARTTEFQPSSSPWENRMWGIVHAVGKMFTLTSSLYVHEAPASQQVGPPQTPPTAPPPAPPHCPQSPAQAAVGVVSPAVGAVSPPPSPEARQSDQYCEAKREERSMGGRVARRGENQARFSF